MPTPSTPLTLHIALATYPKGQSKKYVQSIKSYYQSFKEKARNNYSDADENSLKGLYSPLTFHVFGNFDIAFISLIDNNKFTQKIFFPESDGPELLSGVDTNSYQVLNGILSTDSLLTIEATFERCNERKYICICNLKLSNGFLVGNGQHYLKAVRAIVEQKIKSFSQDSNAKIEFIVVQSFSWFEITVLLFIDEADKIADIIGSIRDISLDELNNYEVLIENSLYYLYEKSYEILKKYNIFADSQSYLGVSFDQFSDSKFEDLPFDTQIEWQVKPGKLSNLIKELKDLKIINSSETDISIFSIPGKSDYWIPTEGDRSNNHKLFQHLLSAEVAENQETGEEKNTELRKYMRRYKTRTLIPLNKFDKESYSSVNTSNPFKDYLYYKPVEIKDIYNNLKALKISRHIRQKINKIYFNYNTGIQDPILCIYFNDFYYFLRHLQNVIKIEHERFTNSFSEWKQGVTEKPKSVYEIEKILGGFIQAFEEGYHIRTLNCYQFEEIYDFDLDLNSSIQQLLTTYNTIVADIADQLIDSRAKRGYGHPQIVQLNLQNTVSTNISINYNVYHLAAPEFVFFTLIKEILNSVARDQNPLYHTIQEIQKSFDSIDDAYIEDLKREGLILPQYYAIDAVQLQLVCNSNIALFEYWFWMYNFQNTSMYSTKGAFEEHHFKKELFRLVFLVAVFAPDYLEQLECPINEVMSYWYRYLPDTKRAIRKLFKEQKHLQKEIYEKVKLQFVSFIPPTDDFEKFYEGYEKNFNDIPIHYNDDLEKAHLINKLMYAYLRYIYEKNDKKVSILRRNWVDGTPMSAFIKDSKQKQLFLVDPLGGLFFTSIVKEKEYYTIQNAMLQALWHFGLLSKKDFLIRECKFEI